MNIEKSIYPYNPDAQKLPLFLSGIGGSYYQPDVNRPHGYHWHQFLFCTEESGILELDGKKTTLNAGQILFLPKNTPHRYYPIKERWGVNWVTFEGSYCDCVLETLNMTSPIIITAPSESKLDKLFEKMYRANETDFLYCDYTCSGLIYDLIIEFHRYISPSASSERSRIISLLLPALRYMHDNFSTDFSMVELSNMIDVTPEHFSRIFKKAMDSTPIEFLTNIRISEAKHLLEQTDYSVSEIASKTGFNDANYFCTVFRKKSGSSPSEYRKEMHSRLHAPL